MNGLNVIETIKNGNCTIYICDNAIARSEEEQKKIWQEFSKRAYKLCTLNKQNVETQYRKEVKNK